MITVTKPKLGKFRSYVLQTSILETALIEAGIKSAVSLHYWTPQHDGSVLLAEYWMPNANVDHRRVYLRAGSIPRSDRADALEQLQATAIPAFVTWLTRLERLPDEASVLFAQPWFEATYSDKQLTVSQFPGDT